MDQKSWHHLFYRPPETHKYDYGHVLILGGSEAMVGAPILAARAALRTGAGLVTIASTGETVKLIDRDVEEIMTFSLPPWNEVEKSIAAIKAFIKSSHVSVLVIGPGLPAAADETIRTLLLEVKLPLVLDAEAFTALSQHLAVLRSATSENTGVILTPHSGEYARLVKDEPQYSLENGLPAIKKFAQDHKVTFVLKQHQTLVVNAQGESYENATGNPGLATAGAGDVLAGIIGGMVAQKIKPYEAAKMGVYLHGRAGDIAAELATEPGMIASDIIDVLPKALKASEHLSKHDH